MNIRIGTRGSKLALAQSQWVKHRIEARHPDVEVTLIKIKTRGDKILDSPLSRIGGKGLFVKEIEDGLLRKDVDVAVHSMKDVPAELPQGLHLSVFPKREDPRDAFVSIHYRKIDHLPEGASVGTGSLRRSAQLLSKRPDLRVVPLRGNVDTRLKKLESEELQAIILAAAGLNRLGLSHKISRILSPDDMLPAIGQGALGLETRIDDPLLLERLRFLNHPQTELTVRAERAFLKELEGGCQVPIAGYARNHGADLTLRGLIAELDGSRVIFDEIQGSSDHPEEMGTALAKRLLSSGADEILSRIYGKD
ncbi:MAG: hydroxymethylbilane synthase [Deltaproteobacteria bacterium]|nr:hydroxymethylbilane synthase [Deltaproteobacteria bacterium]